MCEYMQAGDLPDSQDSILKFMGEGDWSVFYELVTHFFVHIVEKLESPAVFAVETDGLRYFFCGGHDTVNWSSCRVYNDEEICGSCGASIPGISHCERKVTVESATEWLEYGFHIAVEIGTGGLDAL